MRAGELALSLASCSIGCFRPGSTGELTLVVWLLDTAVRLTSPAIIQASDSAHANLYYIYKLLTLLKLQDLHDTGRQKDSKRSPGEEPVFMV